MFLLPVLASPKQKDVLTFHFFLIFQFFHCCFTTMTHSGTHKKLSITVRYQVGNDEEALLAFSNIYYPSQHISNSIPFGVSLLGLMSSTFDSYPVIVLLLIAQNYVKYPL